MKTLRTILIYGCAPSALLIVFLKIAGLYPTGILFELAAGVSIGGVSWSILWFPFRVLSSKGLAPFSILIAAAALFDIMILHTILATWFSFAVACMVMVLLFLLELTA